MDRTAELVDLIMQKRANGEDTLVEEAELRVLASGNQPDTPEPETPSMEGTISTSDGNVGKLEELTFTVNRAAFERGGNSYRFPIREGMEVNGTCRSMITRIDKSTKTAGQYWVIVETSDPSMECQGRGALVLAVDGEGAFKLKDVLDGAEIDYAVSKGTGPQAKVTAKIRYPVFCYASWTRDEKAAGGIKVDNLSPLGKQVV